MKEQTASKPVTVMLTGTKRTKEKSGDKPYYESKTYDSKSEIPGRHLTREQYRNGDIGYVLLDTDTKKLIFKDKVQE